MNLPFKKTYCVNGAMLLVKAAIPQVNAEWLQSQECEYLLNRFNMACRNLVFYRCNNSMIENADTIKLITFGEVISLLASVIMVERPHVNRVSHDVFLACISTIVDKRIIPDVVTEGISSIIQKKTHCLN